jgi:dipeptidyl aminopeptidase/acylaminoacyl peptidase
MLMRNKATRAPILLLQLGWWVLAGNSLLYGQSQDPGSAEVSGKRSITVKDAIEMTRLAGRDYFAGVPAEGSVAQLSPDGKHFVVNLRKGNLENNSNEYSIYLFQSSEVFGSPAPHRLVTMSSISNREAISDVKWLGDSQTIVFLGENAGDVAALYTLNIANDHVEKITDHPTPILKYDVTPDGSELLYLAAPADGMTSNTEVIRNEGLLVSVQSLHELLSDRSAHRGPSELFVQKRGSAAIRIPSDRAPDSRVLSLSPSGDYAIVDEHVLAEDLPASWSQYIFPENEFLHGFFRHVKGLSPFKRFLLVDIARRSVKAIETGPTLFAMPAVWDEQGKTVFLQGVYLPLDSNESAGRKATYTVAVDVATGQFHPANDGEMPQQNATTSEFEVTLEEGINKAPKIFAVDVREKRKALLLDLNPHFAELNFGNVEEVSWNVRGVQVVGGLYLPPNYKPGKRYPLVIQTHGFTADRFSMDGLNEWSSGYAARPLAAQGFLVLQAYSFKNRESHKLVAGDRTLGGTPEESFKRFGALVYEAAVDYLDGRGMIDRAHVGISGFSRTVCVVGYMVTHARLKFAAVALTDGIDCGYFNYMSYPHEAPDGNALNGGLAPFGEQGLKLWLAEAPGFNLDKIHAPVRLVALDSSSVLESWEWFTGLTLQGKPVELIVVPGASHLLERTADRRIAMQGLVDWFTFWLQDKENPDSPNVQQYARWRALGSECQDEVCGSSGHHGSR